MKRKLLVCLFATALTSGCAKDNTPNRDSYVGGVPTLPADGSGRITVPTNSCVAAPDEKCPSDTFLKDWDRLQAIQAKYKPPQEIQDQVNGIVASLNDQAKAYAGFNWDEKKRRFVKQQILAAPPTK